MRVGDMLSRQNRVAIETSTNVDKGAHLDQSLHHTRHGLSEIAIPDGQFGVDALKRKVVHHIRSGICRGDQEDEIIRTILLDTARSKLRRLDHKGLGGSGGRVPGIQYIYLGLLSRSLHCSDFIIRDGISEIIVVDMPKVALANE